MKTIVAVCLTVVLTLTACAASGYNLTDAIYNRQDLLPSHALGFSTTTMYNGVRLLDFDADGRDDIVYEDGGRIVYGCRLTTNVFLSLAETNILAMTVLIDSNRQPYAYVSESVRRPVVESILAASWKFDPPHSGFYSFGACVLENQTSRPPIIIVDPTTVRL